MTYVADWIELVIDQNGNPLPIPALAQHPVPEVDGVIVNASDIAIEPAGAQLPGAYGISVSRGRLIEFNPAARSAGKAKRHVPIAATQDTAFQQAAGCLKALARKP